MGFRKLLGVAAGLAVLWPALSLNAQTLADVAREAKQKNQSSSRRVYTNDDLRTGIPAVRLLRETANPPSLGGYDATPPAVVTAMLQLAGVEPQDLVFDIGSGDGRIVILAAEQFKARGVGIELDETLVALSRQTVQEKGLQDKVQIIHANALDVDLSPADVVTLYLPPPGMTLLRPHLERTLRPGTRVVSNDAEMPGWTPERTETVERRKLFLYRVR